MSDTFTETTSTSWFQRIGNSFKGIVVGFILFIVAFPLLFWNEGRTIKQKKSLKETEAGLVLTTCDKVDPANEGKPVYMTGEAKTEETLSDDVFPVSVNGFKLKRKVEMYQLVEHEKTETKKKLGGGEDTVKTYEYTKEWCDHYIDSGKFKGSAGSENPTWDFEGGEVVAKTGTIGAFDLTEGIIDRMDWYEQFKVVPPTPEKQPVQPTAEPASTDVSSAQPATDPAPADVPSAQPATDPTPADVPSAQPATDPAPADVPSAQPATEPTPADVPDAQPTADPVPVDVPAAQPTADPVLPDAQPTADPEVPSASNVQDSELPPVPEIPNVSETTSDEVSTDATAVPTTAAADSVEPSDAQTSEAETAVKTVPEGYKFYNNGFYKGDPKKTAIGDVRVSFDYVPSPEKISLVSGQHGNTFDPFQTKFNKIELVEKGDVSADAMFKNAHKANSMLCWLLRLVGFLMMFFGLKMIFEPLRVLADVVPFIGSIVGFGTGIVAFLLAAGFSLLTIAVGWVFYRPIIGIPLLIAGLVFLFLPLFKGKKKAASLQPETPFEKQ